MADHDQTKLVHVTVWDSCVQDFLVGKRGSYSELAVFYRESFAEVSGGLGMSVADDVRIVLVM